MPLPLIVRRQRLLSRIHRRFQTITEPMRAGDLSFDFTRIADPNRVLDQVAAEEDRLDKLAGKRRDGEELHLPYWAELWDSSLAIIELLAEQLSGMGGPPMKSRTRDLAQNSVRKTRPKRSSAFPLHLRRRFAAVFFFFTFFTTPSPFFAARARPNLSRRAARNAHPWIGTPASAAHSVQYRREITSPSRSRSTETVACSAHKSHFPRRIDFPSRISRLIFRIIKGCPRYISFTIANAAAFSSGEVGPFPRREFGSAITTFYPASRRRSRAIAVPANRAPVSLGAFPSAESSRWKRPDTWRRARCGASGFVNVRIDSIE